MIIGVVGPICAGKGEFAEILRGAYGFEVASFREEVVLEAETRGIEPTRENLQALGAELTSEIGGPYWAERILGKLDSRKDYVVEGFRYPEQVGAFRNGNNGRNDWFILVGLAAPAVIRLDRYLNKRRQAGDTPTCEAFEQADRRDRQGGEGGQRMDDTYVLNEYEIVNDGTLDDLGEKICELVEILRD